VSDLIDGHYFRLLKFFIQLNFLLTLLRFFKFQFINGAIYFQVLAEPDSFPSRTATGITIASSVPCAPDPSSAKDSSPTAPIFFAPNAQSRNSCKSTANLWFQLRCVRFNVKVIGSSKLLTTLLVNVTNLSHTEYLPLRTEVMSTNSEA